MLDNITCPNCKTEFDVKQHKIAARDKEDHYCDNCGQHLLSTNGAVIYSITKKQDK